MICKYCGHEFNGKFCDNCGRGENPNVNTATETQVQQPQLNQTSQETTSNHWNQINPTNQTNPDMQIQKKKPKGCLIAVCVVAVIILITIVGSCSSKSENGESESSKDSKIVEINDYDVSTNQKETMGNVAYEIPKVWEAKNNGENSIWYYPPKGGMIQFMLLEDFGSVSDNAVRSAMLDGMKSAGSITMENEKQISVDHQVGYSYDGIIKTDGTESKHTTIFFDCDGGVLSIVRTVPAGLAYDYSADFKEIVASIKVGTSGSAESKDPESKPAVPESQPEPVAPPTTEPKVEEPKVEPPTTGQRNALSKAKSYLGFSAFSYSGLIAQLEYEQFSTEDATYGADNCGADWNEQAAKKAKDYLEYSSFSHGSLVDQLVYEGFTPEQAEFGVTQAGL